MIAVLLRVARGLRAASLFSFLLCLFLLAACGRNERVERLIQGATMGTTYSVKVVGLDNQLPSLTALTEAIAKRLSDLNQSLSTYIPDSELNQINKAAKNKWLPVSDDLFKVLAMSSKAGLITSGSFDVTVAPLVDLWGFGPVKTFEPPSDKQIADAMTNIGYQNYSVRASDKTVSKYTDIQFDLSAIAKGYAVDEIADLLKQQGVAEFMVEIGGELRLAGANLKGDLWRIGVESPQGDVRDIAQPLSLTDVGMATSGDYRNYYETQGKRMSHTINPLTGRPITHSLASVTVVAKTATHADAMATAISVLGPEKGLNFAKFKNMAVYLIIREGDKFITKRTKQFEQYMQE